MHCCRNKVHKTTSIVVDMQQTIKYLASIHRNKMCRSFFLLIFTCISHAVVKEKNDQGYKQPYISTCSSKKVIISISCLCTYNCVEYRCAIFNSHTCLSTFCRIKIAIERITFAFDCHHRLVVYTY